MSPAPAQTLFQQEQQEQHGGESGVQRGGGAGTGGGTATATAAVAVAAAAAAAAALRGQRAARAMMAAQSADGLAVTAGSCDSTVWYGGGGSVAFDSGDGGSTNTAEGGRATGAAAAVPEQIAQQQSGGGARQPAQLAATKAGARQPAALAATKGARQPAELAATKLRHSSGVDALLRSAGHDRGKTRHRSRHGSGTNGSTHQGVKLVALMGAPRYTRCQRSTPAQQQQQRDAATKKKPQPQQESRPGAITFTSDGSSSRGRSASPAAKQWGHDLFSSEPTGQSPPRLDHADDEGCVAVARGSTRAAASRESGMRTMQLPTSVVASNWAQISGTRVQNYAVPYEEGASKPLFSAREGLATATYEELPPAGSNLVDFNGKFYVLGGDDYDLGLSAGLKGRKGTYKNDVWFTYGAAWEVPAVGSRPVPHSLTNWTLVNEGRVPPAGVTYETWISCQPVIAKTLPPSACLNVTAAPAKYVGSNMWSPRRGHQVVIMGKDMYVLGGRARALEDLSRDATVGGVAGQRVAPDPFETSWREVSRPMNDVWVSHNFGVSWALVTRGCRAPQEELVLAGGTAGGASARRRHGRWEELVLAGGTAAHGCLDLKLVTRGCRVPQEELVLADGTTGGHGTADETCTKDSDCYGAAECKSLGGNAVKTCVCKMWQAREGHKAFTYANRLWVVGGIASAHVSVCSATGCGDSDSDSHRRYMNDVWSSAEGANWVAHTRAAPWPPRGYHGLFLHDTALYILGGITSAAAAAAAAAAATAAATAASADSAAAAAGDAGYLNDVWTTTLSDGGAHDAAAAATWTRLSAAAAWGARGGHAVVLEPASAYNAFAPRAAVLGGHDARGARGDAWSWGLGAAEPWVRDYSVEAPFRTAVGNSSGYVFGTAAAAPPPSYYVSAASPLAALVRTAVPVSAPATNASVPVARAPYADNATMAQLAENGLYTVADLAAADKYTVLRLRGFDVPLSQRYTFSNMCDLRALAMALVPLSQRYTFSNICDLRALAVALVAKCALDPSVETYVGEDGDPSEVVPVVGGAAAAQPRPAEWYQQNAAIANGGAAAVAAVEVTAAEISAAIEAWDGCSRIAGVTQPNVPGLGKVSQPNVPGLGKVSQVESIRDPWRELQELTCQAHPAARTHFGAAFFKQTLVVVGGRGAGADTLYNDAWIRDDRMPTAFIQKAPASSTPGSRFDFTCDEAVCTYEVRLYDAQEWTEEGDGAVCTYEVRLYDAQEWTEEVCLYDAQEWTEVLAWTPMPDVLPWTPVPDSYDVGWLSRWEGGPGTGMYILYVRAVDPAGNTDFSYREGLNMHTWQYISPLPWGMILGVGFAALVLLALLYVEYRRRRKRSAMRRYAMKRMRRKFKQQQRVKAKFKQQQRVKAKVSGAAAAVEVIQLKDAHVPRRKLKQQQRVKAKDLDWRELYEDDGQGGKGKLKKKKKSKKDDKDKKKHGKSRSKSPARGATKSPARDKKRDKRDGGGGESDAGDGKRHHRHHRHRSDKERAGKSKTKQP
ncbi:hypothetical protein JKP88DRAFT_352587 [Tribonema minus]|uniref:Uncharacterized protein n=1 Tax=Tribonema minus TaxID=303371 RepID=A0A835ZHL5_9STRA|nr:hypothetical protein JKP88DRAFT_352587 [Tribonema minus]